jgi:hypothetical protein
MIVRTTCALCLQERRLRNSHIIPEFLYKALYDDKHRFHVLTKLPDQKDRIEQKGAREPLLCGECERRLSSYERYTSLLFKGGIEFGFRRERNILHLSRIDYRQFKLFQLSILWRASVSGLPFFQKVDLGPHEEKLRKLVLAGDPAAADRYPCLMWGLQLEPGKAVSLMTPPEKQRIHGKTHYIFVFGGFLWDFLVSNKPAGHPISMLTLQESGKAIIQVRHIRELHGLREFMREYSNKPK